MPLALSFSLVFSIYFCLRLALSAHCTAISFRCFPLSLRLAATLWALSVSTNLKLLATLFWTCDKRWSTQCTHKGA